MKTSRLNKGLVQHLVMSMFTRVQAYQSLQRIFIQV